MAVSSITAAICQIPAGLLVDSVRAKAAFGRDLRNNGNRPGLAPERATFSLGSWFRFSDTLKVLGSDNFEQNRKGGYAISQ
jgi:hypothetical protein